MAPSEYEKLADVGRAVGSPDIRISMPSFGHALEFFPAWFKRYGLVPKPGFDTYIFTNDAFESMMRQAVDRESFRLRAYPWVYKATARAWKSSAGLRTQ